MAYEAVNWQFVGQALGVDGDGSLKIPSVLGRIQAELQVAIALVNRAFVEAHLIEYRAREADAMPDGET